MSYHVFFSFSSGLSKSIRVPKGTIERIFFHVADVERELNLESEQHLDNPPHWKRSDYADIDDETLCRAAQNHNDWVHWLYEDMAKWSKNPPKPSEVLTKKTAAQFWHALEEITVPPSRWSRDYYIARMEHIYSVLRTGKNDGVSISSKPLTVAQACDVIVLFSEYLDRTDCRLDVPKGCDYLTTEYEWCEKCGAILYEDAVKCRKRGCPIKKNLLDD